MSSDAPQRNDAEAFDVVLMHGPTEDGEGTRVLRARPGRLDAGEVRPMRDGRAIMAGGEVVSLHQRKDAPALFDVRVECAIPDAPAAARDSRSAPATARKVERTGSQGGPAQVATPAYRSNWELTFGANKLN